jgi:hypothetical protein
MVRWVHTEICGSVVAHKAGVALIIVLFVTDRNRDEERISYPYQVYIALAVACDTRFW